MADLISHGLAHAMHLRYAAPSHISHSDQALSAAKASSAPEPQPSGSDVSGSEPTHEITVNDDASSGEGSGAEQMGQDVTNDPGITDDSSEAADQAQKHVTARRAVKGKPFSKTKTRRVARLAHQLHSLIAIRPDSHLNEKEAAIWQKIFALGLFDSSVNFMDPAVLEKHPDILLFDKLIKIQNLETAREEHNRYEADLLENTLKGALNTVIVGGFFAAALVGLDKTRLTWLLETAPVKIALFALSLSIVKNANEDFVQAIRREIARRPSAEKHKLGDVEVHQVLGQSIDPIVEKNDKKLKEPSKYEDLFARAKIMAVFAKVIAPYSPEEQAKLLALGTVLMAFAVPLTIAVLSRMEYLGQVMEARELNEGFLNRSYHNAKKLSPKWHLASQEVSSQSTELLPLFIRLGDLLPPEICNATAVGAAIAGIAAIAKLYPKTLPDYNIDSHLGLWTEKVARTAFRFMPEVIIFAKYATTGRIVGDALEALGTWTENFGQSIKQLPLLGDAADFGKRMVLWAGEGFVLGMSTLTVNKGAKILAKQEIQQQLVNFAAASAMMCTALAGQPINIGVDTTEVIFLPPRRNETVLESRANAYPRLAAA